MFGEAAAHAAAAAGTLANTALPQPGDTEHAYAQRLGAATRELTPYGGRAARGAVPAPQPREPAPTRSSTPRSWPRAGGPTCTTISVGFCDLVGFTRLGEGVPAADLGAIATRLAALAAEVAEPPVRLVKTIGDAAMFVAPKPAPLLDAALAPDGGGGRPRGSTSRSSTPAPPTARRCAAGATTTAGR